MPSYFYANGDEAKGPFDTIELAAQLRTSTIGLDTLVCREGEETWLPLQDLPEFASINAIPIETIARHLEEKTSSQPSPLGPAHGGSSILGFKFIAILLAGAVGVLVLLALFFQQGSAPPTPQVSPANAPAPAAWITTVGEGFSIESPVLLDRKPVSADINTESYRASASGINYYVDLYRIPSSLPDSAYPLLINGARDKLITNKGRTVISQHFIKENGRNGVDVFFTDEAAGVKYEGGLRVLAGSGRLAVAAIEIRSGALPPDGITRYLDSFQVP